ncbi:MAG: undecaprenyldiphospho-muramoylpentapeptide beta-N-acetylglucosaminyltransferase [Leeuwenhoekiella sp.]
MKHPKFILSGGGTGGHIYPAIAIADALKERYPEAELLFVGSQDRMEMEKVPKAGYEIEGLWIAGLQRKFTISNLLFPVKLVNSLFRSSRILKNFKPDVVIGTGGFASGPLLEMATRKKIPALIQEQNSYAGITNKLLGRKVRKVCVAYDGMQQFFPKEKIVKTGNPVRSDLVKADFNKSLAAAGYGLDTEKPILLILGGSLGAMAINHLINRELDFIAGQGVQVLWQTGKLYYEQYKGRAKEGVVVTAFIDTMKTAYAAADFFISRAGAGSVSELCIVGKPVIFIPSPNVAEDHQTKNAQAVVKELAALMIAEKNLEAEFQHVFSGLLGNTEKQQLLSQNIKKLALPKATEAIVDEIEKLLKKRE